MRAQALVARNLRRLRTGLGLSQEALAADAGIDRTYVSRLERGLENPTVATLEQLAAALSAEIVEFFAVPAPGDPLPQPLRGGRRPGSIDGVHGKMAKPEHGEVIVDGACLWWATARLRIRPDLWDIKDPMRSRTFRR